MPNSDPGKGWSVIQKILLDLHLLPCFNWTRSFLLLLKSLEAALEAINFGVHLQLKQGHLFPKNFRRSLNDCSEIHLRHVRESEITAMDKININYIHYASTAIPISWKLKYLYIYIRKVVSQTKFVVLSKNGNIVGCWWFSLKSENIQWMKH